MSNDACMLVSNALFHRMVDDLTAIVALACLVRYQTDDPLVLAHLEHLKLIAKELAGRIQALRLAQSTAAVVAARRARAETAPPCNPKRNPGHAEAAPDGDDGRAMGRLLPDTLDAVGPG